VEGEMIKINILKVEEKLILKKEKCVLLGIIEIQIKGLGRKE